MSLRWKILVSVGLAMAAADQASKFLAVRDLTPGMTQSSASTLGEQVAAFYGAIKEPCRTASTRECPTVSVIEGFWNMRYVENPGAAWGLLARADGKIRVPFFFAVSIAAIAFIVLFFRKLSDDQHLLIVALSLVFGGALGNFVDRLHLSYVIDFIDWYVGAYHWPTFNVADAAITSGVCLLGVDWIRESARASRLRATMTPTDDAA